MNYNRNELGLLEGVEYQYNEDGSINLESHDCK